MCELTNSSDELSGDTNKRDIFAIVKPNMSKQKTNKQKLNVSTFRKASLTPRSKQYLPNHQCIMLQSHTHVKRFTQNVRKTNRF